MCYDYEPQHSDNLKFFAGYVECLPESQRKCVRFEKRSRFCNDDYYNCYRERDSDDYRNCYNRYSNYNESRGYDRYEGTPPYNKYFEERDYNSIRPAGLSSNEMTQEVVGDVENRHKRGRSYRTSSQRNRYSSSLRQNNGNSFYRNSQRECPISIVFHFDSCDQEKGNKEFCKPERKIIQKRRASCCCPSTEPINNRWKISVTPLNPPMNVNKYTTRRCECTPGDRSISGTASHPRYRNEWNSARDTKTPNCYGFVAGCKMPFLAGTLFLIIAIVAPPQLMQRYRLYGI